MVRETRHLWVGNLPENIREDRIREHFKRYGRVQSVKLLSRSCSKDGVGGGPLGGSSTTENTLACTIAFMDIKSASKAHTAEHKLDERTLTTEYYEPAAIPSAAAPQTPEPLTLPPAALGARGGGGSVIGVPGIAGAPSSATSVAAVQGYTPTNPTARFTNSHGVGGGAEDHPNFPDRFYERGSGRVTDAEYLRRPGYHETSRGRARDRLYRNGPYPSATIDRHRTPLGATWPYDSTSARYTTTTTSDTSYVNSSPVVEPLERRTSSDAQIKKKTKSRSGSRTPSPSGSTSSRSVSRSRSRSSSSSSSSSTSRGSSSPTSSPRNRRVQSSVTTAPPVHSEDRRPLAICVRNLPARSSDTSLKDGLFHEYKKHGKVTWVKVVGQSSDRYALVCFKKPDDVEKALEVSYDKLFFGCKIEVGPYQGYDVEDNEFRPYEAELDEYHPKATRTLFIGNLEKDVTASDLRKHFDQFGEIIEIDIKKQGAVSSYAFCQYSDIESVVKAIRKMDGEHLGNNRIKLGFGKSMPTNCVWVDGVSERVDEKYLTSQFERYGQVTQVSIDRDRGHALIFFDQVSCAQTAVKEMRGVTLRGKKLQVDFASRECQDTFFDHLEKQGGGSERPVFDPVRDTIQRERTFESSTLAASTRYSTRYETPSRPRTSSYSSRSGTGSQCTGSSAVPSPGTPGSVTPRGTGSRSRITRYPTEYYETGAGEYPERRFLSYDEFSQGSGASHEDLYEHEYIYNRESPGHIEPPEMRTMQSVVVAAELPTPGAPFVPPDIRHLQKERVHLLEQLDECPSSGDELMSPKKRLKLDLCDSGSDLVVDDHRKLIEVRRLSDSTVKHHSRRPSMDGKHCIREIPVERAVYIPHAVCKRRKTSGSESDRSRIHHHHEMSGSESLHGSRPGTPLCDERPENLPPSEPRRLPRERNLNEGPLSLPLPRFAAQVLNSPRLNISVAGFKGSKENIVSSPPAVATLTPVPPSPVQVPPPASPPPRPPSSSSDSDATPPSPTLEERLRSLDEKYEKWSGSRALSAAGGDALAKLDATASERFRLRHKLLDLDLKELQPSEIVKSVLAKRSVFDEDSKRLENVGEKYEPKEFPAFPRSFVSLSPTVTATPISVVSPAAVVVTTKQPVVVAATPAKGLQYPFPSHPPVSQPPVPPPPPPPPPQPQQPQLQLQQQQQQQQQPASPVSPQHHSDNQRLKLCPPSDRTTSKVNLNRSVNKNSDCSKILTNIPPPPVTVHSDTLTDPVKRKTEDKVVRVARRDSVNSLSPSSSSSSASASSATLAAAACTTATTTTTTTTTTTKDNSEHSESDNKIEEEKLQREKERQEREHQEKLEQERLEKEKEKEKERLEKEKERQERIEKERLEKLEKLEKERIEKERLEKLEKLEKERIEKERLEKLEKLEKERIEKERLEKLEKLEKERIEKERLEKLEKERKEKERREKEEKDRKERLEEQEKYEQRRREKEDRHHDSKEKRNHTSENSNKHTKENHIDTKHHRENNHKESSERMKETTTQHNNHEIRKEEKSRHHSDRKDIIRDNNTHDKVRHFSTDSRENNKEQRHNSTETPNKKKDKVPMSVLTPASVGCKRRVSSQDSSESPDDNTKRLKMHSDHRKIERRDSKDSRDSNNSRSSDKQNKPKHNKSNFTKMLEDKIREEKRAKEICDEKRKEKDREREREERYKFKQAQKLERQKLKSKSRDPKECGASNKEQPITGTPKPKPELMSDKDFLARLDLRAANDEDEKQKLQRKEKESSKSRHDLEERRSSDENKRTDERKKSLDKLVDKKRDEMPKNCEDKSKMQHVKKECQRIRKITNSSDTSDSDEPKKHSIFDIVDDEPAYISMYDKVKARSCKNMQKQEEEKRQEKLKAKFTQLKQSRAKREEKKRSTSWDEDSDSDHIDAGHDMQKQNRRGSKMLITSSSEDEMHSLNKSRKKAEMYTDSDSDRKMERLMDTTDDEHNHTKTSRKGSRSRITSDTSEDEQLRKRYDKIKKERYSDSEVDQGFADSDDKHYKKPKEEKLNHYDQDDIKYIKKEKDKKLVPKLQNISDDDTSMKIIPEPVKQEVFSSEIQYGDRLSMICDISSDNDNDTKKNLFGDDKSELRKKHKKKQKRQKNSLLSEDALKIEQMINDVENESGNRPPVDDSKTEKKKHTSKKDKKRDKLKEEERQKEKKKIKKCSKTEFNVLKREGKLEDIFGSFSDDSETGNKEALMNIGNKENNSFFVHLSEKLHYTSDSDHHVDTDKEKLKEESRKRKEKKRKEKERRLREENENSVDFADLGKVLEDNLKEETTIVEQIKQEVVEEKIKEEPIEGGDIFRFSEGDDEKDPSEKKEHREKKKKRKKSKEEKRHHHHHHEKSEKIKTPDEIKTEPIPAPPPTLPPPPPPPPVPEIKIEEPKEPPVPQDTSLPNLDIPSPPQQTPPAQNHSPSPSQQQQLQIKTELSVSPLLREPLISPIPKTPTTSSIKCEKKRDKFIPGFGSEIDEKIHETAVKSISDFGSPTLERIEPEVLTKPEAPPKIEKPEVVEDKPRVVISQEETEDAVAALLGESFGGEGGDFTDCYNEEESPTNTETNAETSTDVIVEDDEEMRQAVQSLNSGDLEGKPETPQSENDLQIDTDPEEEEVVRYEQSPRTPEMVDLSRPPKTPDYPANYYRSDHRPPPPPPPAPSQEEVKIIKTPASRKEEPIVQEVRRNLEKTENNKQISVISQSWSLPEKLLPPQPPKQLPQPLQPQPEKIVPPLEVPKKEPEIKPPPPEVKPSVPEVKPRPLPQQVIAKPLRVQHAVISHLSVPTPPKPTAIVATTATTTPITSTSQPNRLPIQAVIASKPLQPTTVILPQPSKLSTIQNLQKMVTSSPEVSRMIYHSSIPTNLTVPSYSYPHSLVHPAAAAAAQTAVRGPTPARHILPPTTYALPTSRSVSPLVKEPPKSVIEKTAIIPVIQEVPTPKLIPLVTATAAAAAAAAAASASVVPHSIIQQAPSVPKAPVIVVSKPPATAILSQPPPLIVTQPVVSLAAKIIAPTVSSPIITHTSVSQPVTVVTEAPPPPLHPPPPTATTLEVPESKVIREIARSTPSPVIVSPPKEKEPEPSIPVVKTLTEPEPEPKPEPVVVVAEPIKVEPKEEEPPAEPEPLKPIESVSVIKENIINEEPLKDVKPEDPLDTKEDTEFWSAKEVNIESVIKKVDALCSADELSENSDEKPETVKTDLEEMSENSETPDENLSARVSRRGGRMRGGRKTRLGVTTRRGKSATPSSKRGGRGGRTRNDKKVKTESDIYEFHDDSDESKDRPRLILTIKSPAAVCNTPAVIKENPPKQPEATPQSPPQEFVSPAVNTRKSRRIQERDGSRSTVDDIIEDVVRNAATVPQSPRRSTRQNAAPKTTAPPVVEPRKSPRASRRKDRRVSENTDESSDEKQMLKEEKIEEPVIKEQQIKVPPKQQEKEKAKIEQNTAPLGLKANLIRRVKSEEPMTLIDPVTGLLTQMRECEEGKYIPVSNNSSTDVTSVITTTSVQNKPQSLKAHVLSSQAKFMPAKQAPPPPQNVLITTTSTTSQEMTTTTMTMTTLSPRSPNNNVIQNPKQHFLQAVKNTPPMNPKTHLLNAVTNQTPLQQSPIKSGPIVKPHNLHVPQQILTGAVASPPLKHHIAQQPIVAGASSGRITIPNASPMPGISAKGSSHEPQKVEVSIAGCVMIPHPTISPQAQARGQVLQAGMPVPAYEASLHGVGDLSMFNRQSPPPAHQPTSNTPQGEQISHFPPGAVPLRSPHDLPPHHFMHSHAVYQQYLRAQQDARIPYHLPRSQIVSGGLEKTKDGQEGEEAPVTSPPLELRRPGSVGLTGKLTAVSHSLQSPHDRATDSPQVAQVYMHQARMPHYHTPNRYYETPNEPPPAHRPVTSHPSLTGSSSSLGAAGNLTGAMARHTGAGVEAPTTQRGLQVATPPHASQVPPQADSLLMLLKQYRIMWQGLLALKNDQAAVQMHFVFGNPHVARNSLPCNSDGSTPPLRIAQRMRLEKTQVEGVARKMQMENEHCVLLALPCGRDHMDVLQQSTNLSNGFITYLQQKEAAGIVNIAAPGSQHAAYVVHIFPSCDFVKENLARIAPNLLHRVADIAHLLIVIATV